MQRSCSGVRGTVRNGYPQTSRGKRAEKQSPRESSGEDHFSKKQSLETC